MNDPSDVSSNEVFFNYCGLPMDEWFLCYMYPKRAIGWNKFILASRYFSEFNFQNEVAERPY